MRAILALENSLVFEGNSFGSKGTTDGEVCFNTSMTGYQEIITDPSYKGQIVTMTYPHIGNYGINSKDNENTDPQVKGLIVKEVEYKPSNWRSEESLPKYFERNNIIGIEKIDTRYLTKVLRSKGSMRGVITTELSKEDAVERAKNIPKIQGSDFVKEVNFKEERKIINDDFINKNKSEYNWQSKTILNNFNNKLSIDEKGIRIVAYNFGIKANILRMLYATGAEVITVKSTTSAEDIINLKPDGIFLSNGPGDPASLNYITKEIKKLIGNIPIFAVCLGHQLICKALGSKTYKLKFGHRGANQPVKDLETNRVFITSQNHGFAVDEDTIPSCMKISQINLNDNTVEAVKHNSSPILSVQYHPEAAPGPNDTVFYFNTFIEQINSFKN